MNPIADVVVGGWTAFPVSPATLFDKLDDSPHDGNATVVRGSALGVARFQWNASAVPVHPAQGALRLRWSEIGGGGGPALYLARVGLYIGGLYYWSPSVQMSQGGLAAHDPTWPVDPSDGLPWTQAKAAATQPALELVSFDNALPRCEVSNLIGFLTIVTDRLHRRAAGAGRETESASALYSGKMVASASREGHSASAESGSVAAHAVRESDAAEGD
jgi:hypothetical protein